MSNTELHAAATLEKEIVALETAEMETPPRQSSRLESDLGVVYNLNEQEQDLSTSSLHDAAAASPTGAKRGDKPHAISPASQRTDEQPSAPVGFHGNIQNLPSNEALGSQRQQHRSPRDRETQRKNQTEWIRNARNTIVSMAILIVTVTFAAALNSPGGFDQDIGKAKMGRQTRIKVFMTFNTAALFTSLGVVNILGSVIPLRREVMMKLLTLTHKIMWLSTLFMSSTYIAAIWAFIPHDKQMGWVPVELVFLGGGCTLNVLLVLGVMLAKHYCRKWERRKSRGNSTGDSNIESSNQDD